jgi:hypothetical protein
MNPQCLRGLPTAYLLSVSERGKEKKKKTEYLTHAATWQDKKSDGKLVIPSCTFRDALPVSYLELLSQYCKRHFA